MAILKAVRPAVVEAMNPVAQRLAIHPADARCILAVHPVDDGGN